MTSGAAIDARVLGELTDTMSITAGTVQTSNDSGAVSIDSARAMCHRSRIAFPERGLHAIDTLTEGTPSSRIRCGEKQTAQ